jgi:hypothetical protein
MTHLLRARMPALSEVRSCSDWRKSRANPSAFIFAPPRRTGKRRRRPPKSIGAEDYFVILSAYAAERSDAEARTRIGAALIERRGNLEGAEQPFEPLLGSS